MDMYSSEILGFGVSLDGGPVGVLTVLGVPVEV